MNSKQLMKQLDVAHAEKDVESAYRTMFYNNLDNCIITSPCISDGLMKGDGVHCLIEVKYKKNFTKASNRQSVIIQCIFYLKQLQTKYPDDPLPTTCFVGDTNECFIFETRPILDCLDNDNIDWSYSPSQAYQYYHDDLIKYIEIVEGNHKYYYVDENFSISVLVNDLKQYHRTPSYNNTHHTRYEGDITKDKIIIIKSILGSKPYISGLGVELGDVEFNLEYFKKPNGQYDQELLESKANEVKSIIMSIWNEDVTINKKYSIEPIHNMSNNYKGYIPYPTILPSEHRYQATKYIGNNTILTDIVYEVDDLFHKFKEFIKPHIYFDTVFIFILFILMLCTIFYFGFYIQP